MPPHHTPARPRTRKSAACKASVNAAAASRHHGALHLASWPRRFTFRSTPSRTKLRVGENSSMGGEKAFWMVHVFTYDDGAQPPLAPVGGLRRLNAHIPGSRDLESTH